MAERYLCTYAKGKWPTWPGCDGRIHKSGCTARIEPKKENLAKLILSFRLNEWASEEYANR